jgi:hypothetical protein
MTDTTNPAGGALAAQLAQALQPLITRMRTDDTVTKGANGPARTGQALTQARLEAHLSGGKVRGCYVMNPGTTTRVAVLDLDNHRGLSTWGEMTQAAQTLLETHELLGGGQLTAFRSGGGRGIHLYALWEQDQDAYSVREWLLGVLRVAGFKSGTGGVAAGEVVGYGELARRAGLPGRARLVARVLREAEGDALPWHRVKAVPDAAEWRH